MEERTLLSAVTVDASQVVRPVNAQILGVNVTWWDSNLNTPQTKQMVQATGLNLFRMPGGSSSDTFHFNSPPTYQGEGTAASMASFIASVGGNAVVTLDYGSGSPQEAAAFLAYLDAPVGSTTPIGNGLEWSDATNSWQTVDWKTAGYWASLRASTPLAVNDGLNFLRIGRSAPFGFTDFEVGNEEYGSWEVDHHGQGAGTGSPHDPATYVAFAKQFAAYAAKIDPTISIGVDTGSPYANNNWISNVLQQCASQGFVPGFLSDHNYVQAPGSESDSNLLLNTVSNPNPSDPTNPYDWSVRGADYESLLQKYLGANGQKVALLATEYNSVYSNPGKQTTSLVNGLFEADSIGSLLISPYSGGTVWDLRNSWQTGGNNASTLYGWRQGGDYGLLGSPGGSAPSTGPYVPYPNYFAQQLASKIVQAGGSVVQVSSANPDLSVYAVHEPNGHLDLMVINKSATGALTGQFQIAGFQPSAEAQLWQYGEAQDTAQSQTTDGHSALANSLVTLSLSGSSFAYSFPAYSMSVLDLTPTSGGQGPTITSAASANPNPVTGLSTALSVAATDPSGASGLTYTWSTFGTPPAPVQFSVNGTNAAQHTNATFSKAGSYTFLVTVTDPAGLNTSGSVNVNVDQTLTAISVSPGSVTVGTGDSESFNATATDQFGNPMATAPSYAWSVVSGGGTIGSSSGVYQAPSAPGTAVVQASSGGKSATASVTIAPSSTSATVTYADTSDWGAGFTAQMEITNTGANSINGWTLEFDFTPTITSIWGATIVSHSGSHYVLRNASYDGTIAPGQSVTFGFNGTPGRAFKPPTNEILNGVAVGSPPPNPSPIQANVSFQDVNDWGSGFTGSITITNTGTTAIQGWTLQFDFAVSITSIWNASILSQSGSAFTIQDAGYNAVIEPGQSVTFGFNGAPGHVINGPSNYVLNGVKIG